MSGRGSDGSLGAETSPWSESTNRVRDVILNGQRIRLFSAQSAVVGVAVVGGLLIALAGSGKPWTAIHVVQLSLTLVALVVAVISYLAAGRTKDLVPFGSAQSDRLLFGLNREQRKGLSRQLRGREMPHRESAPLVEALITLARKRSRGTYGSMVAFLLVLLATALGNVALLVALVLLVAFIGVVMGVESRGWERALRNVSLLDGIDQGHPPLGPES